MYAREGAWCSPLPPSGHASVGPRSHRLLLPCTSTPALTCAHLCPSHAQGGARAPARGAHERGPPAHYASRHHRPDANHHERPGCHGKRGLAWRVRDILLGRYQLVGTASAGASVCVWHWRNRRWVDSPGPRHFQWRSHCEWRPRSCTCRSCRLPRRLSRTIRRRCTSGCRSLVRGERRHRCQPVCVSSARRQCAPAAQAAARPPHRGVFSVRRGE